MSVCHICLFVCHNICIYFSLTGYIIYTILYYIILLYCIFLFYTIYIIYTYYILYIIHIIASIIYIFND